VAMYLENLLKCKTKFTRIETWPLTKTSLNQDSFLLAAWPKSARRGDTYTSVTRQGGGGSDGGHSPRKTRGEPAVFLHDAHLHPPRPPAPDSLACPTIGNCTSPFGQQLSVNSPTFLQPAHHEKRPSHRRSASKQLNCVRVPISQIICLNLKVTLSSVSTTT
jgi:hypothetical protein